MAILINTPVFLPSLRSFHKIFYKKPTEGYFIKKIATDTYIIGKK